MISLAEASGLTMEEIDPADIMREPRFSATRAVWVYRNVTVTLPTRLAVANAFDAEGPDIPIGHLCDLIDGPADAFGAVLALACNDLVEIDLKVPFDGSSIVRLRHRNGIPPTAPITGREGSGDNI